jgi:hypothetical protein
MKTWSNWPNKNNYGKALVAVNPQDKAAWIMGGGRFGLKAVTALSRIYSPDKILVVDPHPDALATVNDQSVETLPADAVDFLVENLKPDHAPKWVVPAVPFHLAFKWLMEKLSDAARVYPVPEAYAAGLPNPLAAPDGGYFASYADFTCPDDCPEPADRCTHTGLPRKGNLFQTATDIALPGHTILVLRSRQIAPGLGGYFPEDLFLLEKHAREAANPVIVVTACRCHGVVHGLVVDRP